MSEEKKSKEQRDYEKGLEHGYVLTGLNPNMARDLIEIKSNAFYEGLKSGKEDFEREQRMKQPNRPAWLQEDRLKKAFDENAKDKSLEKVKDKDIDKERD